MSRHGRILIYGYHGMGNVGADARLLAIRDTVRGLAPGAEILVNSFDKRGLADIDGLTPVPVHPAAYALALPKLLRDVDLVILSEGNMLTDEFTAHMVRAFRAAVNAAADRGIPTVGMALDSGRLSPKEVATTVAALNRLDLLTVRTPGAVRVLESMGVTAKMHLTADCALSMPMLDDAAATSLRERLRLRGVVHGIAPVDFYMWPARVRPFGRRSDYVRWPFKGTWPEGGRARSSDLVAMWTKHANAILAASRTGQVALVAMERIDERFCERIIAGLSDPGRAVRLYSSELDPRQMAAALGGLHTLASSRYHAVILGLLSGVPYLAFGHDTRTRFISSDLGLEDAFIPFDDHDAARQLAAGHERLCATRDELSGRIEAGLGQLQEQERRNGTHLARVLHDVGYPVPEREGAPTQEIRS